MPEERNLMNASEECVIQVPLELYYFCSDECARNYINKQSKVLEKEETIQTS